MVMVLYLLWKNSIIPTIGFLGVEGTILSLRLVLLDVDIVTLVPSL